MPFFTGLDIINTTLKAFNLLCKFKAYINSWLSGISSGLFNSNHSQYLKLAAFQNYSEKIGSEAAPLYLGQLLNNH